MARRLLAVAVCCAFVGTMVAIVATHGKGESTTTSAASTRIVVTRTQTGLPRACRPRDAARFVQGMFTAFSTGDRDRFLRIFFGPRVPTERFRWFSIVDGVSDVNAVTRSQLLNYLASRVRKRDRVKLRHIDVKVDRVQEVADFGFFAVRRADDLPPDRGGSAGIFEGKGAYNCRAQTMIVFSASMEPAPGQRYPHPLTGKNGPCPLPVGWHPLDGPVVACTHATR